MIKTEDIEYAERRWPGDALGSVRYGYLEGVRMERETVARAKADPGTLLRHPNGKPMYSPDGTLLDDRGKRSIFDDVDR